MKLKFSRQIFEKLKY